jgi:uncharacterized protein YyaL (SSP411 family)
MSNRLISENSPYLLQHADNPVDWYPWGEDALQKAREEDKPIFLSIGYSACHWCHVMAHESFEDEGVAAILNEHFISIKVDREERPDLDRIYMTAVQAITGGGGWPMSVFLTPDGHPFYGGTYFPPQRRYGLPSFTDVLLAIVQSWQTQRDKLLAGGEELVGAIRRQIAGLREGDPDACRPETLTTAFRELQQRFDRVNGGWGGAPKFPQPMVLEFLLRYHHSTGEDAALAMVTQTLEAMARGGMYDQLGGGFHRYSVDEIWLTPHFERMLYDNAQLARVYLHAWQVTEEPFYRTITEEILDYVVREMTCVGASASANTSQMSPRRHLPDRPSGYTDEMIGFYSTQDADSEGEEGKFFVWTPAEIREVLGDRADAFMAAYGVTERGNFEGKNILSLVGSLEDREALAEAREKLFAAREERVHPDRDDKVLTSWNGLMLAAFAEAGRVLERQDYLQVAEGNAAFLLSELRRPDGRLWHTWKDDQARFNGYLEDYSYLIEGLLELYQATFEPRWYQAAHELAELMIAHFRDPNAGFFDTSDDHEDLIVRPKELQDSAVPSGNSITATVLLRLAGLAVEATYIDLARGSLSTLQPLMSRHPLGFAQWLIALDYALARPREIAIVGEAEAEDTQALLDVIMAGYSPHQVVAFGPAGEAEPIPLLDGRDMIDGRAAAYVCVDFSCKAPVVDPEALRALLKDS